MSTDTRPQAAPDAIAWREYGAEAFALAKQLDRPVLVDVGAVWCHWCHVMDRTTYEQADVAELVNERFVAIKVDRDRRPAVDRRLQQSVQAYQMALSGRASGGWPLTAFLTPNGALIHGETYMSRERFLQVANAVAEAYREHKDQIEQREAAMARLMAERRDAAPPPRDIPRDVMDAVAASLRSQFDARHGGFGTAPKFPAPTGMTLLMHAERRTADAEGFGVAVKTLTAMAEGGLHDHVGGGFHRYSVDARWVVPHFEKMLDVNAGVLDNCLDLVRAANTPSARRAALGTIRFVDEVLSDRARGGFYASQDADINLDDDGSYFTWTLADFKKAVPDDVRDLAISYFGVAEIGEMEEMDGFTRTPTDQNVLHATKTFEQLAKMHDTTPDAAAKAIERALEALRRARAEREKIPFVDRTILVDWNAAMIRAYLKASVVLKRPDCRAFAVKTLDRILAEAYDAKRGVAHVIPPKGPPTGYGHLVDNVGFAAALLDAYEFTGERRYLDAARTLMDLVSAGLYDAKQGGFFDRQAPKEAVGFFKRPHKDIQDHSLPSGNALAADTLVRLAVMTGEISYRDRAEQTLASFSEIVKQLGSFGAGLAMAIDRLQGDPAHLIVVGPTDAGATGALHAAALEVAHPRRTVQVLDPKRDADLLKALGYAALPQPAIFVCGRNFCLAPVKEPQDLPARIEELNERHAGQPAS